MTNFGFKEHVLVILLAMVEDGSERATWRQVEFRSKVIISYTFSYLVWITIIANISLPSIYHLLYCKHYSKCLYVLSHLNFNIPSQDGCYHYSFYLYFHITKLRLKEVKLFA